MCSCQLWKIKDMNIWNVCLLVMENKGYEHLECVLDSSYPFYLWNRKDMNIQNVFWLVMENKGYENLECVLASYGIERI